METFLFDLPLRVKPACLLHLKGMKHDSGNRNWAGDMAKLVLTERESAEFVRLPNRMKAALSQWVDLTPYR